MARPQSHCPGSDCCRARPNSRLSLIAGLAPSSANTVPVLDTGKNYPGSDRRTVPGSVLCGDLRGWHRGVLQPRHVPGKEQRHLQPSLHCWQFPSSGCSSHLHLPHQHTHHPPQIRAAFLLHRFNTQMCECVWNSNLLFLSLQKLWQRRRNCCLLMLQTSIVSIFPTIFFYSPAVWDLPLGWEQSFCSICCPALKVEFLNVIMNKWSRLINLESRPFHEPEMSWFFVTDEW